MIIKVCGMRHAHNIAAVEPLAHYMGFIFYPRSPRYVSAQPEYLPEKSRRVGVFVNATDAEIDQRIADYNLGAVQLHGNETNDDCLRLKDRHPHIEVIRAISISTPADIDKATTYTHADTLLFDTKTTAYGGSGRTFDWSLLTHYQGSKPFLLSGGISPDHAHRLRTFTHPMLRGYDLNSRFELSPGLKDPEALRHFITSITNDK